MKKILLGGSPCTFWSSAKKQNRETIPSGKGWELFENYSIAKEKFNPDFFLYENNKSVAQGIKEQIARELGVGTDLSVSVTNINSALVSAQTRERFYVTNFGEIEKPQDRKIYLRDILAKNRSDWRPVGKWVYMPFYGKTNPNAKRKLDILRDINSDKAYTLTTKKGHPQNYILNQERTHYTNLTIEEYEILQTLPVGYTKAIPETERYKAVGNGWTAEVIKHILGAGLKGVDRNERLVVLSMYDGIATGRYVLESLGFQNVEYHSYEIDKFAIAVAQDNYPEIVQHGDAFQLRENDWRLDYAGI